MKNGYECACGCGDIPTFPSSWVTGHEPGFPYADAEPRESSVFELWRGDSKMIESTDLEWLTGLGKQIDARGHGPCLVIERRTVVTMHVRYGV